MNICIIQFDYSSIICMHTSLYTTVKLQNILKAMFLYILKKCISNISKMDEQIYEKPPEWSYACYSIYLFS